MPARSKAQRVATAIALHHPEQLYARNAGLAKMSDTQLRHFASTKEKGLPQKVRKPNRYGQIGKR